jgi:succinate dehydrogenase / fumarate reductase iron-sulfur subunit
MIIKVRRFDPTRARQECSHYDVRVKSGMTVLSALAFIQDRLDPTLAFRYSCRGAACGTCAMLINKVPRLACRTQVRALIENRDRIELKSFPALGSEKDWHPEREILVEPLPLLHVIKDLVVDMRKFFMHYRLIKPTFRTPEPAGESELPLDPGKLQVLEPYLNCVLCAACYSACPVGESHPNYLGPAALAKLYRFALDPRENQEENRLRHANEPDGWWACEFHGNCRKVCPKGVTPNLAIGAARARLKEMGHAREAVAPVGELAALPTGEPPCRQAEPEHVPFRHQNTKTPRNEARDSPGGLPIHHQDTKTPGDEAGDSPSPITPPAEPEPAPARDEPSSPPVNAILVPAEPQPATEPVTLTPIVELSPKDLPPQPCPEPSAEPAVQPTVSETLPESGWEPVAAQPSPAEPPHQASGAQVDPQSIEPRPYPEQPPAPDSDKPAPA